MLEAINYSEARKNLASLMNSVCNDSDIVVITRRRAKPVVMMSLDDYNSIQETVYLTRTAANAARLRESMDDWYAGRVLHHPLIASDELDKVVD